MSVVRLTLNFLVSVVKIFNPKQSGPVRNEQKMATFSFDNSSLGFSQCDSCFLGNHPKPNASTGGG